MTDSLTDLRDRIIEAALPHVPFDGWTTRAMRRGAQDAGLTEGDAFLAFPYGTADMVVHFSDWSDRRMVAEMERRDVAAMKIRNRIATAVRVRRRHCDPCTGPLTRYGSPQATPQPTGIFTRNADCSPVC
jgi:ubiquinone biosynthesis protein COQ9